MPRRENKERESGVMASYKLRNAKRLPTNHQELGGKLGREGLSQPQKRFCLQMQKILCECQGFGLKTGMLNSLNLLNLQSLSQFALQIWDLPAPKIIWPDSLKSLSLLSPLDRQMDGWMKYIPSVSVSLRAQQDILFLPHPTLCCVDSNSITAC